MYRNVICVAILACLLSFGTIAQAQLFNPPVDNPSFEVPDLGAGGTGQWANYAEAWIIESRDTCFLEDGTWEIVAPDGVAPLKMCKKRLPQVLTWKSLKSLSMAKTLTTPPC
ncbi:MAG: hypothetical protein GY809_25520 [Planctomycetes bacterium]|nr:hypothetical protein [Planctomycetota bacterium]